MERSRGIYDPEMFLMRPDGSWFPADEIQPNRRGSLAVRKNETYRVIVLSYGPFPDAFELMADLRP